MNKHSGVDTTQFGERILYNEISSQLLNNLIVYFVRHGWCLNSIVVSEANKDKFLAIRDNLDPDCLLPRPLRAIDEDNPQLHENADTFYGITIIPFSDEQRIPPEEGNLEELEAQFQKEKDNFLYAFDLTNDKDPRGVLLHLGLDVEDPAFIEPIQGYWEQNKPELGEF
jgi:hypothetical protein